MRPLTVLLIGMTLFKAAVFLSVLSLIRFSPADPGELPADNEPQ